MNEIERKTKFRLNVIPVLGFYLALVAGLAAVMSGLGTRWSWWHFRTGFMVLKWAAVCAAFAAAVSVAGIAISLSRPIRRGMPMALIGVVLGCTVFGVPWYWYRTASRLPRIHDISTDTLHPPQFLSVLPLRKNAMNPPEYGGPEIAQQQAAAYPDIKPLYLKVPPPEAFEHALEAARHMNWEIVDANKEQGRIEATDTTFFFGFKDDIVVRITPQDSGSRVDIRSVSRVGISDVGTNAKRIARYLKTLSQPRMSAVH